MITTTKVFKASDAEVLRRLRNASSVLGISNPKVSVQCGSDAFDPTPQQLDDSSEENLFRADESVFDSIYIQGGGGEVRYDRKHELPFDHILVRSSTNPPSQSYFHARRAIAELFDLVPATVNFVHQSGEPFQQVLSAQVVQLGKLAELTAKAKTEIEEERQKLQQVARDRETDFEAKRTSSQNEIEAEGKRRSDELLKREAALNERELSLNLKSNTAARRELHKGQQKLVEGLVQSFRDSSGLSLQWWFVFVAFVLILSAAGWTSYSATSALIGPIESLVKWSHEESDSKATDGNGIPQTKVSAENSVSIQLDPAIDSLRYFFMAKSLLASITFVIVGYAWIRWLERTFRDRSTREQFLQTVEVDTYRANWLVETAFEWQQEKEGMLPELLIEKLSQSLYQRDGGGAATVVASTGRSNALAGMRLKTPALELNFSDEPKGGKEKEKP